MSATIPSRRAVGALVAALISVCVVLLAGLPQRSVAAPAPVWSVEPTGPSYFVPGHGGALEVVATNSGTAPAGGITVTDTLPAGATVVEMSKLPPNILVQGHMAPIELYWCGKGVPAELCGGVNLATLPGVCGAQSAAGGQEVVCTLSEAELQDLRKEFGGSGRIEPGQYLHLTTNVMVSPSGPEGPIVNTAGAEGGGAPSAGSAESQSTVSSRPAFGIAKWSFQTTEAVPSVVDRWHDSFVNRPVRFSQAGGHPDALTATIEWATEDTLTGGGFIPTPTGNPKDVYVTLPQGLLGNPTAAPKCPITQALGVTEKFLPCPASTQVGTAAVYIFGGETREGPIYNITPEKGQSAEFLLTNFQRANFTLTAHVVRTLNPVTGRKEYTLQVDSNGEPNIGLYKVETTFWGNPASETHKAERGLTCYRETVFQGWRCKGGPGFPEGNQPSGAAEVPFLTWQSDCAAGPEHALVQTDSWEDPVRYVNGRQVSGSYLTAQAAVPAATGCGLSPFAPGLGVEPDTLLADTPVGLGVNLSVPQFEEPGRLGTPELRKTVISLPPGVSISPGIVDGIQACEESGPEGINFEGPESEEVGIDGALQLAPGHCPGASIVGTAEATTPLLDVPIKGHVYLARPGCGNAGLGQAPCTEHDALDGNLYRLYLELGGTGALADTGVNIKVRLDTQANPATGQLTAVAEEIAQLPFSELKVHLNGGPRAPLDNPATCGPATATADFSTWAAPGLDPEGVFVQGIADATPSSFYEVKGCAQPPGLAPGFLAGTVNAQAGQFSPFTVNITRKDREQFIKGVQVHTPPGLLGMLSSVPLCGEPQADTGTCPESSKIGTTRVASGAGSHPFEIEGNVYLTGPYRGSPFGLSIVTHAVAGPFNLGLVIVRARIAVNPNDSTLTVTTDETGPYAIPQIIFGVPLRLQRVTVNIDRPAFMFNPTNCNNLSVGATVSGSQNALATTSSPFQATACANLKFAPQFSVHTSAHTSRLDGASLGVKLSYPAGAMGTQANVKSVKVELPKALPSRLSTLQRACTAKAFDANPASCPPESIIGHAVVQTQVLPVPLQGPAYFVSNGSEAFPNLIVVLQGYGVRVDLVGNTLIKNGITSSTFAATPDVPFDSFELALPKGEYSALTALGNLCHQHLTMPTAFTAQNGATLNQKTPIEVEGCAKKRHARHHRARKHHHKSKHARRRRG